MSKIEFDEEKLELLLNINLKLIADEKRLATLETDCVNYKKEIDDLKMILAKMVWASSKVALIIGGTFGGMVSIGYWATDALHWRALTDFFKTLRGG